TVFISAALVGVALFAVGRLGVAAKGFPSRLSPEQQAIIAYETYPRQALYREGSCFLDPEQDASAFKADCAPADATLLLWGDSHAAALSSGLRAALPIVQYTASGCPPAADGPIAERPNCRAINHFILEEIRRRRPPLVLLQADWIRYEHPM